MEGIEMSLLYGTATLYRSRRSQEDEPKPTDKYMCFFLYADSTH